MYSVSLLVCFACMYRACGSATYWIKGPLSQLLATQSKKRDFANSVNSDNMIPVQFLLKLDYDSSMARTQVPCMGCSKLVSPVSLSPGLGSPLQADAYKMKGPRDKAAGD